MEAFVLHVASVIALQFHLLLVFVKASGVILLHPNDFLSNEKYSFSASKYANPQPRISSLALWPFLKHHFFFLKMLVGKPSFIFFRNIA